jgi:hypothetical protein
MEEGRVMTRMQDGQFLSIVHSTGTDTWTNVETGESLYVDTRGESHDVHVTDNGDGTYTTIYQASGNAVAHTADGTILARSAGLNRLALTFEDHATPGDPSDDEVVGVEGLLSAGARFDICALVESTIG